LIVMVEGRNIGEDQSLVDRVEKVSEFITRQGSHDELLQSQGFGYENFVSAEGLSAYVARYDLKKKNGEIGDYVIISASLVPENDAELDRLENGFVSYVRR